MRKPFEKRRVTRSRMLCRIEWEAVLQGQRVIERGQDVLADGEWRLAYELAVDVGIDRRVVEEAVARADHPARVCLRLPGDSDARAEIVLVRIDQRAGELSGVRSVLPRKHLGDRCEARSDVEAHDVVVLLVERLD